MQDLINKLTAEVGLTAEQASKTIATIMDHVKAKLPTGLSGSLDSFMGGSATTTASSSEAPTAEASMMDKAGDFAEQAKDKAEEFADQAKDKLEDFADQAKEKLGDAAEKAEEMAKDAFGKLKGMFGGGDK